MKLENQVCSLKLAKKLKGLGVKQKSLFWWDTNDAFQEWFLRQPLEPRNKMIAVSAFTVAELGEMLPAVIQTNQFAMNCPVNFLSEKQQRHYKRGWEKDWICFYGGSKRYIIQKANTEANCRAKMLIYLKEETKRGGEENGNDPRLNP